MKKRLLLIALIFLFLTINSKAVVKQDIKEYDFQLSNGEANIVSSSPIRESLNAIDIPEAYSVQTSTDTVSGARGVRVDKATSHTTFDYADFYSLNQLDAEQLKDANLRNRVLTFSHFRRKETTADFSL